MIALLGYLLLNQVVYHSAVIDPIQLKIFLTEVTQDQKGGQTARAAEPNWTFDLGVVDDHLSSGQFFLKEKGLIIVRKKTAHVFVLQQIGPGKPKLVRITDFLDDRSQVILPPESGIALYRFLKEGSFVLILARPADKSAGSSGHISTGF